MARKSSPSVQQVKKGRRTVGAYYTTPAGITYYLAWRRTKQIVRYNERDISAAIRAGKAAWGMEEDILVELGTKGIRVVGILDRDTGDQYFTNIDYFYDHERLVTPHFATRIPQRYLPFQHFKRRVGTSKV